MKWNYGLVSWVCWLSLMWVKPVLAVLPIAIDCSASGSLKFGTLVAPTSGSPAVNVDISLTNDTLTAPLLNQPPASLSNVTQRLTCLVSGEPGSTFTVTVPPVAGGQVVYRYPTGLQTLDAGGQLTIYIGGTLDIASAPKGSTTEAFTVQVDYSPALF